MLIRLSSRRLIPNASCQVRELVLQEITRTDLYTIAAGDSDLKSLDFYSDLTSMPKQSDPYERSGEADVSEMQTEAGSVQSKQASKKVLGRLKSKQALLAKAQASGEESGHTPAENPEVEQPKIKRTKSERGDDVKESGEDVAMDES